MINRKKRNPPTELNEHDRKILGKYTGFFTNMIESNTAETDIHQDYRHKDMD